MTKNRHQVLFLFPFYFLRVRRIIEDRASAVSVLLQRLFACSSSIQIFFVFFLYAGDPRGS